MYNVLFINLIINFSFKTSFFLFFETECKDTTIYHFGKIKIIVGHLVLYYLESLISIEDELLVCSENPNGNKRRLMFKFRLLYAVCVQNRCKNCLGHKVKEVQEAQRRCEAMSNNHLAIGKPIKKQRLHIIGKDRRLPALFVGCP